MTNFTMKDLSLLKENRKIEEGQVKRLEVSIKEKGYIEALPIIVNEKGQIIDGQHRYQACKNLSIEPTIAVAVTPNLAPLLNTTQLRWKLIDYVNYWAAKGIPDYIILQGISQEKEVSPDIVYNVEKNKALRQRGASSIESRYSPSIFLGNDLKEGSFRFISIEDKHITQVKERIDTIKNTIKEMGLPMNKRLVNAFIQLERNPKFSYNIFLSKLKYQKNKTYICTNVEDYKKMITDIYNYRNLQKLHI